MTLLERYSYSGGSPLRAVLLQLRKPKPFVAEICGIIFNDIIEKSFS